VGIKKLYTGFLGKLTGYKKPASPANLKNPISAPAYTTIQYSTVHWDPPTPFFAVCPQKPTCLAPAGANISTAPRNFKR